MNPLHTTFYTASFDVLLAESDWPSSRFEGVMCSCEKNPMSLDPDRAYKDHLL